MGASTHTFKNRECYSTHSTHTNEGPLSNADNMGKGEDFRLEKTRKQESHLIAPDLRRRGCSLLMFKALRSIGEEDILACFKMLFI